MALCDKATWRPGVPEPMTSDGREAKAAAIRSSHAARVNHLT